MIYVIKESELCFEEKALVLSIQGVVNRKNPSIYVDCDIYMNYLNEQYVYVSVEKLLEIFYREFRGYIAFDCANDDVSVNMAASISACYDIIGVPRALEDMVKNIGLTKLADLADVKGTMIERQRIVFEALKPRFNRDGLVHQVVLPGNCHMRLRDMSIARGWPCVFTDESVEGKAFLSEVLTFLDQNIAVYGWTVDELSFVKELSLHGDYVIPTDWSNNHSFFEREGVPLVQKCKPSDVKSNKHYLAIVVSDGDNIQWLERDFTTTSTFGQRLVSKLGYKMNWTFAPTIVDISSRAAQRIYSLAGNDRFMASVSGVGYCNCLSYPKDKLVDFTDATAEYMKKSDLCALCLLDDINNMKDDYVERLDMYAKHKDIIGGVWELDPDRYVSGNGKIYYSSNGKPFISVRYTFWPKGGDTSIINEDWLDWYVDSINGMPISPESEEGYTVLNINPWTTTVEQLDYVVSRLSDNVEIVYIEEMINLINKNIKR